MQRAVLAYRSVALLACVSAVTLVVVATVLFRDEAVKACNTGRLSPQAPVLRLLVVVGGCLVVAYLALTLATDRGGVLAAGFAVLAACMVVAILIGFGDPGDLFGTRHPCYPVLGTSSAGHIRSTDAPP